MTMALHEPIAIRGSRRPAGAGRVTMPRSENVLAGAGLALIPWVLILWRTLPADGPVAHWNLAWVGLDLLEAGCLGSAGVLARRGDPRQSLPLTGAGTALLIDGWFDVTTAASTSSLATALGMLAIELPLAAYCLRRGWRTLAGRRQRGGFTPARAGTSRNAAP